MPKNETPAAPADTTGRTLYPWEVPAGAAETAAAANEAAAVVDEDPVDLGVLIEEEGE